jgi:hypothetical protein
VTGSNTLGHRAYMIHSIEHNTHVMHNENNNDWTSHWHNVEYGRTSTSFDSYEDVNPRDICSSLLRRSGRDTIYHQAAELSTKLMSYTLDYEIEKNGDTDTGDNDFNSVKYIYRDETWSKDIFIYDPKPKDFLYRRGIMQNFHQVPSMGHLFHLIWPESILHKIVIESNHYATHLLDILDNTMGEKIDIHDNYRIESFSNDSHVHGDEKATKYSILLREGGIHFPLSHHLK